MDSPCDDCLVLMLLIHIVKSNYCEASAVTAISRLCVARDLPQPAIVASTLWNLVCGITLVCLPASHPSSTPCLKNVPRTFGLLYNFDTRERILIFFGRYVSHKVGNQKPLYYATSNNVCFCTIWQHGETRKSHFFPVSRVQQVSDLHPKFALRPHHVWKYGRHSISDL